MTNITGITQAVTIGTPRGGSGVPVAYRLARYRTAEGAVHLKLQGAYQWRQGANGGHEWRDIETVDLDQEADND